MAEYKNQHFVPRVHLKPFSDGGEGKSISLFTSKAGKYIHSAAVAKQCSKDYFYGRDGFLEHKFNELETHYATRLSEILSAGRQRPDLGTEWMRLFWCAQWARTEAAATLAQGMARGLAEIVDHEPLGEGPADGWTMLALSALKRALHETRDLAFVVVRNQTAIPFLTSDNPAVIANKFNAVDSRACFATSGMGSAGALLLLPISPEHCALWYDSAIYSVESRNGWCDVRVPADAMNLNEHQILNCECNVYFSSSRPFSWIQPAFDRLADERQKPLWEMRFGVLDGVVDGVERYRFIEGGRTSAHPKGLVVSRAVARYPTGWPAFLRWRHRGVAYDTGTGAGIVRPAFIAAHPLQRARTLRVMK